MPDLTFRYRIILLLVFGLAMVACHSPFGIYHRVQKGETLSDIGRTYHVSVQELKSANYLRNPNILFPGQRIFVPNASREKKIAVYAKKSRKQKKSPAKSSRKKKKKTASRKNLAKNSLVGVPKNKVRFSWPADGVLTSGYGIRWGKLHQGIDISGPIGKPIYAAADGVVIYSGNKQRGYGNLIIIEHDHGFHTVYAHNNKNYVKKGDRVRRKKKIAEIGKTGKVTGAHLHFEIRYKRTPVDPLGLLP